MHAFFLPVGQGHRFCLFHTPVTATSCGAILFIHPFAEEMNKSRRMAALQARALADAGWSVLQIDLLGCGDSSGDFGDATWDAWIADVVAAEDWLYRTTKHRPVLWGLRAGCLLITSVARRISQARQFVFWQPVVSGRQFLQQFLRLKIAQQVSGPEGQGRITTQQLRGDLQAGKPTEIAGYTLSARLALDMESTELDAPPQPSDIVWIEIDGAQEPNISPAADVRIAAFREQGHRVDASCVSGPRFWQTLEIAECPALIDATLRRLSACTA
jgi:uncharacterized protein